MLSYPHAFYADIVQHWVWPRVRLHLNRKDKRYCIIDGHTGADMFHLSAPEVQKKSEY
ncbi:MAG: 23S rRNA A2030 N6-methylase RlmJ [Saprospiraceae bacterium]|jgi:23S rRNA A2030 N6-methylase RlmJ